jgi:hypothetical protein
MVNDRGVWHGASGMGRLAWGVWHGAYGMERMAWGVWHRVSKGLARWLQSTRPALWAAEPEMALRVVGNGDTLRSPRIPLEIRR